MIKSFLNGMKSLVVVAALLVGGGTAQAITFTAASGAVPITWSFDTGGTPGVLSGTGTITVSGFGTSSLTVAIT